VKDRISELEDKIEITEENLVKQLKSCEKNMDIHISMDLSIFDGYPSKKPESHGH
jgi:hypothetical protein